MALVSIPGGIIQYPLPPISNNTSGPSTSAVAASASGHRIAMIVRVPKTGTLDKFEWMCQTYIATNTVRHSFQDVDAATGFPDGTVDQFRTGNPTGGAWMVPGLVTSDGTDTGVKRSVTKGDLLACVVDFSAYTSGQVNTRYNTVANPLAYANYVATFNGAAWATVGGLALPIIALKYDDGSYAVPRDHVWAAHTFNSRSLNTGTTPDEIGVKFTVPFDCTAAGAVAWVDGDGDFDLVLYSAADAVLASVSLDKDMRGAGNGGMYRVFFAADVAISKNTTYRLVVKPTTVTSVAVYDGQCDSAALMVATPGGDGWVMTERTNAGAWTDTSTRQPWGQGLLISQVDDGTGSGGGGGGGMRLAGHGGLAA